MFPQALAVTLRLLLLRAGPEDFPYDAKPNLTVACVAFCLFSNAALVGVLMPWPDALISSAANIAFLGLFMRFSLTLRKLDNRFQQSFNALMTTSGVLALAMLPLFAQFAPELMKLMQALQANPALKDHPEQWPPVPAMPLRLFALLAVWQLIVICRIFKAAAGLWAMLGLLGALFMLYALQMAAASG